MLLCVNGGRILQTWLRKREASCAWGLDRFYEPIRYLDDRTKGHVAQATLAVDTASTVVILSSRSLGFALVTTSWRLDRK